MTERVIDLATWPRAGAFRLFRSYEKPHFALTTRLDVTRLMARRAEGVSPFRACLHALAAGFHAVPELRTRFRGADRVVEHDRLTLSPTIALPDGGFGFGYIDYQDDWPAFDAAAAAEIAAVRAGAPRVPNTGERDDLLYLSCLPWVDFTGLTNALPGAQDCIPRLSWGKFVPGADGHTTCAFTAEVHHAIADGAHLGQAITVIQDRLDTF
ncbi:MAG: CatA-like O-acetyltransferase [Salibaculum sp.]|uniref:CatA-like O-acetyltransferase n=1 Tax=Roseovarius halophilus (ex Wu et al. 2025) TaxID=3376060 RepID=UPI0028709E1F|nr:CatA-like O-acetyltransferase [Salibaculum sp.]MDR9427084.1 CatA-like O-acetyltransferase [Salibaculum sp.]MDR9481917.1 CatA-like O-acetyltransferase [Salibaculum sp.]